MFHISLNMNDFRGQSYKDFYTLGQIYKRVLKHKNNALTKTFIFANINISLKNNFNIEIQSVLNSQCVSFIWEK